VITVPMTGSARTFLGGGAREDTIQARANADCTDCA
jgi:hypothetical protein